MYKAEHNDVQHCTTVPSKERDSEFSSVRAIFAANVQLPFVPDKNVFCPKHYRSVGVSNHQLSYKKESKKKNSIQVCVCVSPCVRWGVRVGGCVAG